MKMAEEKKPLHVLAVETDWTMRDFYSEAIPRFLPEYDVTVDTLADGRKGLEKFLTESGVNPQEPHVDDYTHYYNLVIADRLMPEIRKYDADVPVLLAVLDLDELNEICGKGQDIVDTLTNELTEYGKSLGISDFMFKPSDLSVFKQKIRSLLNIS